jgi:predicted nucleic-acid-binding protein
MIALDTNVIARFYVDDPADPEAQHQRPLARQVFESGQALFVPLTVVLELAWVLRAFYNFKAPAFIRVMEHLAGLPNARIEQSALVLQALKDVASGLDFADALHLRASAHCAKLATFDGRKFARKAARLGLLPVVWVPG